MAPDQIEQRLAAIEAALADIQKRLPPPAPPQPWWKRFEGAFDGDPAFDEVVRLGRELNVMPDYGPDPDAAP